MASETPPPVTRASIDWGKYLPVGAIVLLMVEVYGVSDFSVTSSLAIIASAGVTQVVVGAALSLLPYLLPIVFLLAAWRIVQAHRIGGISPDLLVMTWAVLIASLLLSAWQNILVVAGAAGVYVALFLVAEMVLRRDQPERRRVPRPHLHPFPMVVVALLIAFFSTVTSPWTAPEVVTVKATPAVIAALEQDDGFVRTGDEFRGVAYPLDDGGGSLSVLARTTRRVIRLPSGDVVSRSICRYDLPSHREVLMHELLGHRDDTPNPNCPTRSELGPS
jgi:hypothetical protein